MDLITLCSDFIRINSCTQTPGTKEIVEFIAPIFRSLGAEVSTQEVEVCGKTNLNLLARFSGADENAGALVINTHLDTVAPGEKALWTICRGNPFAATLADAHLHGLGAADTKLAMACVMIALENVLKNKQFLFKRTLNVMASAGEEVGLIGARHALESGFVQAQYALISEPSELDLVWAHKGLCACVVKFSSHEKISATTKDVFYHKQFHGEAAHSSTPHLGVNALEKALDEVESQLQSSNGALPCFLKGGSGTNVIPAEAEVYFRKNADSDNNAASADLESMKHFNGPVLTTETLRGVVAFRHKLRAHLPALTGEKFPDFLPPQATSSWTLAYAQGDQLCLVYDYRFILPDDGERFHAVLEKVVQETAKEHPSLQVHLHLERLNLPMFGDKNGFFLNRILAIQKSLGLPALLKTKAGCTEGALFAAHGMEAIVVGPGRAENNIHKPNEKVAVKQLESAVRFYGATIEKFCGDAS